MLVVNSGFEEGKSGESALWKYHDDLTGKKFQRPFHPSVHSEGDAQESLNADLSHSRGNVGCQSEPRNSVRVEIDNLAAMLDCSPIPTLMISCGRDVVSWNRACEVLTHVPKEHVLGKPLDFRHFFNGRCLPVLANLLLEGNKEEILKHVRRGVVQYNPYLEIVECKGYIQVGGDRKILRMSATKMKDGQGRLLGAVQYAQDITREERIQKHLEHAQKMESLGALAGAMVHEFNNLLLAIQGYSELMLQKMDSQHPLKRYIVTIDSTCQKAAGMARSMLDFARGGERKSGRSTSIICWRNAGTSQSAHHACHKTGDGTAGKHGQPHGGCRPTQTDH
jgi:PAS domain-containing protein